MTSRVWQSAARLLDDWTWSIRAVWIKILTIPSRVTARGHANPITESTNNRLCSFFQVFLFTLFFQPPLLLLLLLLLRLFLPLSLPLAPLRPFYRRAAIIPQVFLDSFLSRSRLRQLTIRSLCLSFVCRFRRNANKPGWNKHGQSAATDKRIESRLDPSASSRVSTHDNADNWSFKVELNSPLNSLPSTCLARTLIDGTTYASTTQRL